MDHFLLRIPESQYSFEQFIVIDTKNKRRNINMKMNTHNWYSAMRT